MSTRDARMLALGVVACACIVLAGRGIPAWNRWRESARERMIASEAVVQRATAALAGRARVADALRRTTAAMRVADSLTLSSVTAADGAAQLATISGLAADQAGMRLGTMQLKADTITARLARTTVKISGVMDVSGLTAILQELETGAPLLVVRELAVSQNDPMAADDRPEQLRVDLTVEGLARVRPDTVAAATRKRP